MDDTTSLLFGLDSFRVVDVVRVGDQIVQVVIETVARQGICPGCGAESTRVKDRPLARMRDLPVADQHVALWRRKRRLLCREPSCPRTSFMQATVEIPPRSRLTARLRKRLAEAVARSNRAVTEVAAEYGVAWRTVHRALVAAAAGWLGAPAPTRGAGHRRDPRPHRAVDPGRVGVAAQRPVDDLVRQRRHHRTRPTARPDTGPIRRMRAHLAGRTDPSVPGRDRAGRDRPIRPVRVGHPHGAAARADRGRPLASGPAGQRHAHRGPPTPDPPTAPAPRPGLRSGVGAPADAAHRRRSLIPQATRPSDPSARRRRPDRRDRRCLGLQGLLRQLLAEHDPARIRAALWRFYDACAQANMRETTRLAHTIETWWPAILVALTEDVTNARTEGLNRVIKQVKRVGCGFTNMDNYRRRIMAHIAVTRPRLQAA
jgi:transposase